MWKWPLTAMASMTQPATFSPTTVNSIAPARPHSRGVSPSRIVASRARGSAIGAPSWRVDRNRLGLTAIYLQQRTAGSCRLVIRNWDQITSAWRSGGGRSLLGLDLALDPGQHRRHPAQPQRADQVRQAELGGELGRGGQDLLRA